MADASQNNPMKEFTYALVGVLAFAAMVAFIGVSAFLRPAGVHVQPEVQAENAVATEDTVEETVEATATDAETTAE